MYRIDIGLSRDRGYLCEIIDVAASKLHNTQITKVIRGGSIEQLASRIRNVLIEEVGRRRHFPLESEPAPVKAIITPESGDPFFQGGEQNNG